MQYDTGKTRKEFDRLMADIRHAVPQEFEAFIKEKETVMKSGRIPEKNKWLLLLVASVSHKCPVCIAMAVERCLKAGWTREEMLESCMVGVLVGGSSVMTYVTLVEQAIQEHSSK